MSCDKFELTPIKLYILNDNCSSMNNAIPALATIFPETTFKNNYSELKNKDDYSWSTYQENWEGVSNLSDVMTDALLFRSSFIQDDYNNDTGAMESLRTTMLAMHLEDFPDQINWSSPCDFGKGAVGKASYTKAVCDIKKVKHTTIANDKFQGAYPDHGSLDFVPLAYTSYFQARFIREVNAGNATTVITPDDLVRFYQVYQITKNTMDRDTVTSKLDVQISLVRVSTIFLINCTALTLLCAFGTAKHGVFSICHYRAVDRTPQSKLDWMLQSVEGNRANMTPQSDRQSRHSVTSMRSPELGTLSSGRRKSDFETAT